jgi:serine/threonine protein kinase/regulation of enolase protein 1 (concanavalin A-like superfamily)
MPADPNRVKELFLAATELPDPAARAAYLDAECGGDAPLRERVEALLRAHDPATSFLNTAAAVVPGPEHAGTMTYAPGGPGRADDADAADALGFLTPPTRPDSLGRIGHYEVLQVLGKGGFGIVFRAFDDVLQRVVAVKVMAPQLAATSPARKRFLREAQLSAKVRHENVVQVHEIGEAPLPFLVMEFIPGETLQQRLNRVGPVEPAEVVRVGRQIAEGLAAAHANDMIHRDIKPGNVLIEGGQQRVKITDFGLARAADDASISRSGIIAGTPMYMAPEQALGHRIDHRADLFSLGSVLYQMAAGRPPFRASTTVAVLKRVAEDTPRPIREVIPETPQWLCDIIAKLHAKDPDDRYQTAREVADVLADCEEQLKAGSKLRDFSRLPRRPRPAGRRKWLAAAVALLLPVFALTMTEAAGVTHLLRKRPTPDAGDWTAVVDGQDVPGWGRVHDPAGDGTFESRGGVLRLAVPAGDHDLSPLRDFNLRAPRVWEDVEGDFTLQVRVDAPDRTPAASASRAGYAVAGAGLLVWQDENNFVRFVRAYTPVDAKMPVRVEQHWFRNGSPGGGLGSPDTPWLQLERKAGRVVLRTSADGRSWVEVGAVDLAAGGRLRVGVVAVSTLDKAVAFQFSDRELTRTPPAAAPEPVDLMRWGSFVNPKQAASILREPRAATLRVPGNGPYDLLPLPGFNHDAPRLVRAYDGDFRIEVTVPPFPWPGAGTKHPGRKCSYLGAGLLVWVDEKSLLRFERAAMGEHLDGAPYVHAEWYTAGELRRDEIEPPLGRPDEPLELRVERRQSALHLSWRQAGAGWTEWRSTSDLDLPARVSIGLVAINTTDKEFAPRFENLTVAGVPAPGVGAVPPAPAADPTGWAPLTPTTMTSDAGATLTKQADGSVLASGTHPAKDTYVLTFADPPATLHALRLDVLPHDSLPKRGPGRHPELGFVLTSIKAELVPPGPAGALKFVKATADHSSGDDSVPAFAIDDQENTGWCTEFGQPHYLVVELAEPVAVPKGAALRVRLEFQHEDAGRQLGCFRLSAGVSAKAEAADAAFRARVATLPAADQVAAVQAELKARTPGGDVRLEPTVEAGVVTELRVGGNGVADLAPVRALAGLKVLHWHDGPVSDLTPLKGLPLEQLTIARTKVGDLSPLAGMKLKYLNCDGSNVADLTPLTGMPLEELGLHNTRVADLTPLTGMPLKRLQLHETRVTNLAPLKGMALEHVTLTPQTIGRGMEVLRDMRSLQTLGVGNAPVLSVPDFWAKYVTGERQP